MNILHSLCVWLFDIWHLFDILTSFLTWATSACHRAIFLNWNHRWSAPLTVANWFWPTPSRSWRDTHRYIQVTCNSPCILADTAWVLPKLLVDGLYYYYCWFVFISMSADCFKVVFCQNTCRSRTQRTWWDMDILTRLIQFLMLLGVLGLILGDKLCPSGVYWLLMTTWNELRLLSCWGLDFQNERGCHVLGKPFLLISMCKAYENPNLCWQSQGGQSGE